MPYVPSKNRDKVRNATVTYDGESFGIHYRPNRVTPAAFEALKTVKDDEEGVSKLVGLITSFVSTWEIGEPVMNGHTDDAGNSLQAVGDDGQPLWDVWPVDREHASELSFPLLRAIVETVTGNLTPGEVNAGD